MTLYLYRNTSAVLTRGNSARQTFAAISWVSRQFSWQYFCKSSVPTGHVYLGKMPGNCLIKVHVHIILYVVVYFIISLCHCIAFRYTLIRENLLWQIGIYNKDKQFLGRNTDLMNHTLYPQSQLDTDCTSPMSSHNIQLLARANIHVNSAATVGKRC